MQTDFKLYKVDMKYIRNLHNIDDKALSISPRAGKDNRVFIGIVVICGVHKYCIPLSSPKIPTNLPHPPTSAYFPQDTVLHIQAAHLLPEHLRRIPSMEWFSIYLLPCCSLFVKNNLHRYIRQCCYGGYPVCYML